MGWYIYGAKPGEIGAAVVVGHLDSTNGSAVFANLKNIKAGETVSIDRADGSKVNYVVERISKFPQNKFPTEEVYGKLDYAGLRLITCAGSYSRKQGHYSDNLIVFARLIP